MRWDFDGDNTPGSGRCCSYEQLASFNSLMAAGGFCSTLLLKCHVRVQLVLTGAEEEDDGVRIRNKKKKGNIY